MNTEPRSTIVIEKAIDRVRKLLALAEGTSEHEAALAAGKAAKLVEQFQLTEAMLRIDDKAIKAEPIETAGRLEPTLDPWGGRGSGRKRIAWKETLAKATAADLGIRIYWKNRVDMNGFGRESAIQTWRYVFQYLVNAVDALTNAAWKREADDEDNDAGKRAWKNAFRVGCAQRVAIRMREERDEREKAQRATKYEAAHVKLDVDSAPDVALAADRTCQALATIAKDQDQVDAEYKEFSKDWGSPIASVGSISSNTGYSAGTRAGDKIKLGGGGKALAAGQGRLK